MVPFRDSFSLEATTGVYRCTSYPSPHDHYIHTIEFPPHCSHAPIYREGRGMSGILEESGFLTFVVPQVYHLVNFMILFGITVCFSLDNL